MDRERLAWTILVGSFAIFMAICLSVPWTLYSYAERATRPLEITIQANQGAATVLQTRAGGSAVVVPGSPLRNVAAGATIITNSLADTALLQIYDARADTLLARVVVYGNSRLVIEEAAAPRFGLGESEKRLTLNVQRGRVRLVTPTVLSPNLRIGVQFNDAAYVYLEEGGQYSFQQDDDGTVHLSAQAGRATAQANDRQLQITANERTYLDGANGFVAPLPAERNLARNGAFEQGLTNWTPLPWQVEWDDQPPGTTRLVSDGGGQALRFERSGIGHVNTAVQQTINQDVTDFRELRALVVFRLLFQNLPVCGYLGSECPLTLRIEYEDVGGSIHVWQQSFFISGTADDRSPLICVTCSRPYLEHQPVPRSQLFAYESENLFDLLAREGLLPPARIRDLRLIVAGHTFAVEVVEVGLMALE